MTPRKLTAIFILLFVAFYPTSVFSIKSFKFDVPEPELVVYPNHYQKPANRKKSRLMALASEIDKRSESDKKAFIKIALTEMAFVYQEESNRAAEQASLSEKDSKQLKLYRWSQHALSFSETITAMHEDIGERTEVDLLAETGTELYIILDGRPVLISSPVINEQKILEERIISSSCARFYCDMKKLEELSGPDRRSIIINAGWVIDKDRYIFRTETGLNFVFNTIKNKKYKQLFCLKIARDLNLIAEVLRDISGSGIYVDWQYLHINSIAGDSRHELILNQFKDAIYLELESIQFLNDFPEVAIPWFKERLHKDRKEFYFHKAEYLIAELAEIKALKY